MYKNIRRINLFGGPGSAKSTVSAFLYYNLKIRGLRVEQVYEYIKMWTYIPRKPISWDSFYCQAKQITKEDIILRGNVDYIVSDSPVLLQYFYAWYHKDYGQEAMISASRQLDNLYPSLNIFLSRPQDAKYDTVGRYEKEEESKKIDGLIIDLLKREGIEFKTFDYTQTPDILNYVLTAIEK